MNGLQAFIGTLFELVGDGFRRIMNSVWCVILAAVVIYLTQLCLESMVTTAIVALACNLLVFYALLNPRKLFTIFALGEGVELTGETEAQQPGNKLFDTYWSAAMYLLFWVNALCFFAPLAPLRDNPLIGYFLLFGGIAIIIMYPGGKKFRKITCWGIGITMVLMLLRLGSPAWWTKQIGMDLFDPVRVTKTNKAVVEALAADQAAKDRQKADRLHDITVKRNRGEKLSNADQKLLDECRQGNVQRLWKKMFSSPPASAAVPAAVEKKADTAIKVTDSIRLAGKEGQVDIKFFSQDKRDILKFFQDPGPGFNQLSIFINGEQDPSWGWHTMTKKGITRFGGVGKFLKSGDNVLTIKYRLEMPVNLKDVLLDHT
ncbi:MAG: hypothetical protein A3J76_02725 [Candidatus Moranbacteria bacterium RBG_13_45_13]|nr:MAG: hypothetical protein A3J76_02725 [Candidatus Moranbacteria bacterium RBG_13_45_13]